MPIPGDIEFWGLDSGERHAVGGSDYGAVRAGAFMGLRMLSEQIDVPGGYLANLDPSKYEGELLRDLPEEMSGDEFIRRHGGTSDTVTSIEPERRYRVRTPTAHPVYERRRAERFRALLCERCGDDSSRRARLVELGALMSESHAGYGACGLGSPGTNRLAALVRDEGPAAGLYGSRITGGGSGGTVAVVGRHDASPAIDRVARNYQRETGYRPYVFAGSSPGAAACGVHAGRGL